MAGKLFIVAKGNVATFESLRRSVGHERGITIIYDRRSDAWDDPSPARFWAHLRRKPGAAGARAREEGTSDRRRRDEVAEEIRRQGWAVVRRDREPDRSDLPSPPRPRVPRVAPPAPPPVPIRPPPRPIEPPIQDETEFDLDRDAPAVPRRRAEPPDPAVAPGTGAVDLPIARDIVNRVMLGVFAVVLLLLAAACVAVLLLL